VTSAENTNTTTPGETDATTSTDASVAAAAPAAGAEAPATATRTRTRLDPEQRRELIIDAAQLVFADRDPGEVTFEQIADAAGVSRALVYNYFGDKGGLIAAVYLRSFERLDVALMQAFSTTKAGPDRLRAIIRAYLDFATDNASVCHLISAAEANVHPLVQHARRKRFERMASGWGNTPESRLIARAVVSVLEGAALDWLDSPAPDRERTEHVLYALLWSGLTGLADHGVAIPR
jgi:AcrR family transcriptional regulator